MKSTNMTVTLMVMTLNEVEGMRAIMPRVKPEWCDQILVVDGGSTDGTIEYAREHGYDVHVQVRKGLRFGYNEAFPKVKGDVVITFSPDGNSIPELIPELIAKMKDGCDMVIASRYAPGAHSDDDDWLTGFGNWVFTTTINVVHRAHYTDVLVIYRAYKTKLFYDLALDQDESYVFEKALGTIVSIEPLLSIRAAKKKLKLGEIPGDEPPRIGGTRKMLPFRWGTIFMAQIFRELYHWR